MDGDFPLNPKNVEYLLPPDIFDELFSESNEPKEHQNQSDSKNFTNHGGGVTVQAEPSNNSVHHQPSPQAFVPDYEGVEKNVQHALPVQQAFTWAQIVGGDSSYNYQGPGPSFPPLMKSPVKSQKPQGEKKEQGRRQKAKKSRK